MSSPYIPTREADALIWMQAFASTIQANFATYELTSADATTISNAVQAFADALAIVAEPTTRTPVNVNTKDTLRNAAENLCRQYATQIKYNNGISDASKIAAGVRPVNNSREPIFVPQTSPLVNVTAATPGAHTVRFADSLDPNERKKPFGAASLQLFCFIGDEPTVNEDDAKFIGLFTKNPIAVAFDPDDDGKMATYFARWSGKRGDTGPWSLPVSMRIAA